MRLKTLGSLLVMLLAASAAAAQPLTASQAPPSGPQAAAPAQGFEKVVLTAGRSTVLPTDFDITRIAVTNPAVADAVVVQPREILIDGKSAGTVSLIIWGVGRRAQFDVVVEPGVSTLQQRLQALFPGEDITVDDERRSAHPVGARVEHGGDAQGRRDCAGERAEGESRQHAAAARERSAASR